MTELHFFVARKSDGSPMFMQHQTPPHPTAIKTPEEWKAHWQAQGQD